jgi:hypothetical protein
MNPCVQGKTWGERSHPPLKRIKDWLVGGPSHTAAVTGMTHPATITITHPAIIRKCPGIFFIPTMLFQPPGTTVSSTVNTEEEINRSLVKTPAVHGPGHCEPLKGTGDHRKYPDVHGTTPIKNPYQNHIQA